MPFEDMQARTIEQYEKRDKENIEIHLHPKGWCGASNLYPCPYASARTKLGLMPKKMGVRADKGGMWSGTDKHEKEQTNHRISFEERPSELFPGCKYEDEVYVSVPILTKEEHGVDLIGFSPIDESFIKPNDKGETVKWVNHQFKNKKILVRMLADGAKFESIHDIKGMGDFGWKINHLEDLSDQYKAQGHLYMLGAGLDEIAFDMYSKTKASKMHRKVLKFDPEFWQKVVKRQFRIYKLENDIKSAGRQDLAYFTDKDWNFKCRYCTLSVVEDIYYENGTERVELLKPCELAHRFAKGEAKELFKIGTEWKRGNSHITIIKYGPTKLDITEFNSQEWNKKKGIVFKFSNVFEFEDYIVSRNGSGTLFIDHIYSAKEKFKPRN